MKKNKIFNRILIIFAFFLAIVTSISVFSYKTYADGENTVYFNQAYFEANDAGIVIAEIVVITVDMSVSCTRISRLGALEPVVVVGNPVLELTRTAAYKRSLMAVVEHVVGNCDVLGPLDIN